MSSPNYLDISLLGKEYRVACPPEEHDALLTAVGYVDAKMRDIADRTKSSIPERIAVMAALNIAHELLSRDLDAATDFYRELLGAKVTKADVPMDYRLVGVAEGADFAGLMAMPDEVPAEAPSYWSIYFEVDDAAAAVDFASESGATVIFGPQTMPDIGTIANVLDPEHAAVSVLEPPRGE